MTDADIVGLIMFFLGFLLGSAVGAAAILHRRGPYR